MRARPKNILAFLTNNLELVRLLFNFSREDDIITTEEFSSLCKEKQVEENKLVDYKIVKELPTGGYKVNKHYTNFLEFLFQEFYLSLPEALEKRSSAIDAIFTKLLLGPEKQNIVDYIKGLIDVIDDFLNDIDNYTSRLLSDTESLKSNSSSVSTLAIRIQKANYWIEEFIKPLNYILDKAETKSIVNLIGQIGVHANQKKYEEGDYNIRNQFEKLYLNALNADKELNIHLRRLTRELLPLLDRIKTNSLILSGFYHFLEGFDKPVQFTSRLIGPIMKSKYVPVSGNFENEARIFLEHFRETKQVFFYDEQPEESTAFPDSEYFREILQADLPVSDFYLWCYRTGEKIDDKINMEKFTVISGILLEREFNAEFDGAERYSIELSDVTLNVPKVRVYAN